MLVDQTPERKPPALAQPTCETYRHRAPVAGLELEAGQETGLHHEPE